MTNAPSERGFILLAVLTLLTLLASVILVLSRESASGLSVGARELEVNAASLVAEAGLQHAVWKASSTGACSAYTDLVDVPFGEHAYSASYSKKAGSPVAIRATGTLDSGATQTLLSANSPVYQEATTVLLRPDAADGQDATIDEQNPDDNFGAAVELAVSGNTQQRRSLLRFELGSLPTGTRIVSAVLELQSNKIIGEGNVTAHRVTNDWVEGEEDGDDGDGASWIERDDGEAWAAAGGDFDPAVAATNFISDASGSIHQWDLAGLVDAWLNRGVINNGLILVAEPGLDGAIFHSSDNTDPSLRPRLSIRYACECAKVCSTGVVTGNYCDADFEAEIKDFEFDWSPDTNKLTGIDYLPEGLVVDGVTIPADGGWIMADDGENALFITDSAGADLTDFSLSFGDARGVAYVKGGTWANHFAVADKGDDRIYFVDLDGDTQGSIFVKFIAEEPFGVTYIGETGSGTYDDHLAYVSKKNGAGEIYIIDQAGVLQKTIDIDAYAPVPQGVAQLPGASKFMVVDLDGVVSIVDFDGALRHQYHVDTWDLLQMRGSTIHPVTCEHVLIDADILTVNGLSTFDASGASGAGVLMVVADKNSLTTQEEVKKGLIESWNYETDLINDNANSASYDAAIAANDVVFIGEDASAGQIGDQLVDAPIGVITEEAEQAVELGLSSAISWGFDATIDIDDNQHYITLPFSTGPLEVLDTADSLAYLDGTLSPDVRVLGSTASGPMLSTLEAAAQTADAESAAGRRALLPWGGANFQLSNLNTDGRTIFQRALEWGVQPPPRCDADYVANNVVSEYPWMPDTNTLTGVDYLPAGLVVNSVTIPAGGGWVMSDSNDRLFVTDVAGNPLTDFEIKPNDIQGVALVEGGFWRHKFATADNSNDRLYYLNLDGSILWSFDLVDITNNPLGLGFVGTTASAVYDNALVISSDKNPSGGGTATLYVVDQWGAVLKTIDIEAFAPTPQGVTHVTGADKFIVADKAGTVSVVDFDGNLVHQYSALSLGLEELNAIGVNPMNCEHVLVNKRPVENIVSVNRVLGSGPRYAEAYIPWSVTAADTWETVNFEIYGVEPNAVLEFAVMNTDGNELWGGARRVGSSLERRVLLHRNDGGREIMTMHVQSDSLGRVELYADKDDKIEFLLLGYWMEASYVENMQSFKAGANSSWRDHALNGYGVGSKDVAEILIVNNAGFDKRMVGARSNGSSLSRRIELHEAEDGGSEVMSMFTEAGSDGGATVEVYAQVDADIDFYLLGHWSTPPGTFTSAFDNLGTASANKVWEDVDLSSDGVPANAVVQIMATNNHTGGGAELGVRAMGSVWQRLLDLHKAEYGGLDFPSLQVDVASMHVSADADGVIEWYDEDVGRPHHFYLLGWWVLNP